jgi:hypothetical protein
VAEGDVGVGKTRSTNEPEALPDGYYWLKNFINLRGGGHVRRWKLAQVVGGRVRVVGSSSELDQGCPYLRHALWVRAEPPADDRGVTVAGAADRVRLVAGEIVDLFVGLSETTAAYYARHPQHREELVARIAGLIDRVRG